MATLPLVDKYGKVEEYTVAKAYISRKLSEKVNWANVGMDGVPVLLNGEGGYFWVHPAIRDYGNTGAVGAAPNTQKLRRFLP